jgi:hypothetical protein
LFVKLGDVVAGGGAGSQELTFDLPKTGQDRFGLFGVGIGDFVGFVEYQTGLKRIFS